MPSLDLTTAINQTIDPMGLMQRVTDRTLELIAVAEGVMVGLADDRHVVYLCGAGRQTSNVGTRVGLDSSLSGLAIRTGVLQRSNDTSIDPRVDGEACRRLAVGSLVCVPLRRSHDILGVLAVNAKNAGAFTDDDVALLRRLADFVSAVIGSAWDLDHIRNRLLELGPPASSGEAGVAGDRQIDPATRYVMGVLSPDTITELDRLERIRAILGDPQILSMVFQPIIDITNNAVFAVEALARFALAPYQSPDVWFDDAHKSGIGIELEMLAVSRALRELPHLANGVALTVNVGPATVISAAFRDVIHSVPASRVIVELTEHVAIDNYPLLVASLRALRQSGIRIAIDDTGSGYSGLSHILKLAPDFIKLDRELVSGIDIDPVRRALATSLVMFASDTGAAIIAEGVENEDELDALRNLGLRYVQGFYLARPATLEALALKDLRVEVP